MPQSQQVTTVEVHQPGSMQQQCWQLQQQQQTVNDLIEMDNESRDSRQSHRSICTYNSQPPPFQSVTNRNVQQQLDNFNILKENERNEVSESEGNQEEEEGGGRDQQNIFTNNHERFELFFPQTGRRFVAASEGGFHFAYGGGGGASNRGGGSSVSSRTRKQL